MRRGRIVPVYDASHLVGRKSSMHRFYLIARCGAGEPAEFAAIPVAGECELVSGEIEPVDSRPAYVSGTLAIGGESVEVVNLDKLIAQGPLQTEAREERRQ